MEDKKRFSRICRDENCNVEDGINDKLDLVKERFSELKGVAIEILQNKTQGEKRFFKNEKSISKFQYLLSIIGRKSKHKISRNTVGLDNTYQLT